MNNSFKKLDHIFVTEKKYSKYFNIEIKVKQEIGIMKDCQDKKVEC